MEREGVRERGGERKDPFAEKEMKTILFTIAMQINT